jgi:hypothetical protein
MSHPPDAAKHWTSFAWTTRGQRQRRAGAVDNISIQIRYCTATVTDKPLREMPN